MTSPSPGAFNLSCRLPVTDNSDSGTNRGWVSFPGGQFTRDTSSQSNGSYDWAIHSWVPVSQSDVASDGATYVLRQDAGIYLVNAKTGNRRLILSTQGPGPRSYWSEISQYSSGGVYLKAVGDRGSDAPSNLPGLWVLNPHTGRVRLIGGNHEWEMMGPGSAWAIEVDFSNGGEVTVFRLDLATGQSTVWYKSKTSLTLFTPTPDGELLVGYGQDDRLALLGKSRALILLNWPQGYDGSDQVWSLAQPGAWLTDTTNLDLYVKGAGIRHMAVSPYQGPMYPAGDCR